MIGDHVLLLLKLGINIVTFVDDFSRMTWIYFMKNRFEVFTHFSAFCAEVKTQFDASVRILRSDNAKEYMSELFQSYMRQHGILHQSSCVDTPSQNGVAERKTRHLLETARALLFQMKVPKQFWADAVSIACFLINRMPLSVLAGDMPYTILFLNKSLFPVEPKVFGSTCYIRNVQPTVTKLDPKALRTCSIYSRRPPIVQVYSRRRETNDAYPVSIPSPSDLSSLDSSENLDLSITLRKATGTLKFRDCNTLCTSVYPSGSTKSKEPASRVFKVSSMLGETAASIALAATVVGAAATILVRRNKASGVIEALPRICEDCGGSGVCAECRGEGFVLKKMSDENAERSRLMAKNAATRYTAGLPKKWSYCMKCNAARSCSSCGGFGKLN